MRGCTACGSDDGFVFDCEGCGQPYCEDHYPPDRHECPARTGWLARTMPGGVSRKATGSATQEGDPPDDPSWLTRLRAGEPRPVAAGLAAVLVVAIVAAGVALYATGASPLGTDGAASGLPFLATATPEPVGPLNLSYVERSVIDRVNEARAGQGVDPVAYDRRLADIALAHSQDMAANNYTAHVGPSGETVADRYERFGYDCEQRGELVLFTHYGQAFDTPNGTVRYASQDQLARGIVQLWELSEQHRSLLLDPTWERMGVGVAVTADRTVYVTLNAC